MAKQTIDGITADFQQGGWYSGRQYWGDTLSAPSVINSQSNQVGAGQVVSKEVIAQTNPANVSYVQGQQTNTPTIANQVTPYLNNYQSSLLSANTSPENKVQTPAEIATDLKSSGLLPSGTAPTTPNLAQTYQDLSTLKGVDALQASITDLKTQQDAIASQLQVTKTAEKGKPVPMNVIEGRISTEQQQSQDQYDFIGRQLARKQDELTSTLSNIKMIMDFTQQDYTNASTAYNTQFDQAITTFNLIHGIQQDQKNDIQKAQDNARANLQIMVNAITNGNLSLSNLSPDQTAQLNKLEVQSGLPVGFISSIKKDPKADILFTNTSEGVTQVGIRNADGSVSVQSYGKSTKTATTTELSKQASTEMSNFLSTNSNSYGHVTGTTYIYARNKWVASTGGTQEEFDKMFSGYTDPYSTEQYHFIKTTANNVNL